LPDIVNVLGIAVSFLKSLRQQVLDPVDFGGDVAWRKPVISAVAAMLRFLVPIATPNHI
jgi:hypothetical protein